MGFRPNPLTAKFNLVADTSADIVDFDTAVTNHVDVAANTVVRHIQNTDIKLDSGQPNEVTAAEIRTHLDNPFGSEFQFIENLAVSITTSTIFQNKIDFTTFVLPAGNYRIEWSYGWNHDARNNNFHARLVLDNDFTTDNFIMEHRQEPIESGGAGIGKFVSTATNQLYRSSGFRILNLSAGTHNLKLDFRTDSDGDESSIWDATIMLFRVS